MASRKRLRHRIVARYRVFTQALKGFGTKSRKKTDGSKDAPVPPVPVSKVLLGGPTVGVKDVVVSADEDDGLRILNANGNGIHTNWQGFIDHAIAENLITQPIVSGQNVTCSSSRFFGCVFHTDSIQKAFEVPRISLIEESIVMGLKTVGPSSNNVSLNTLIETFQVSLDNPEVIKTIFTAITSQAAQPSFSIANFDGFKNASWIRALDANSVEILTSLVWQLASGSVDLSDAQNSLKDATGLLVETGDLQFSGANTPRIRFKHRAMITRNEDGTFSTAPLFEVIIEIPVQGFLINLKSRTGSSLSASITRPMTGGGNLSNLLNLLSGGLTEGIVSPSESGLLDNFELWKVKIVLPNGFDPESSGISFMITFFVKFQLPSHPLLISLSYDMTSGTFAGRLLLKTSYQNRLNPNFEELEDLPIGKWQTLLDPPDLRSAGPFRALPTFIPTKLDSALITYRKGSQGTPFEFSFSAALVSDSSTTAPTSDGGVPFPFDWQNLTLQYSRRGAASAAESALDTLSITTSFELDSVSGRFQSGSLDMGFTYTTDSSGSSWVLRGSARYIQLGAIAEFLDSDLKGGILDVVGKLSIDELDVVYTFNDPAGSGSAAASSFLFSGTIGFGELKLKLFYQYSSAGAIAAKKTAAHEIKDNENLKPLETSDLKGATSTWRFDAYLDVGGPGATIGMIADSIVDDASKNLPPFVRDIEIQPPSGSPDAHLISLHTGKATKTSGSTTLEGIVFLLNVSISTVEFSFEQLSFPDSGSQLATKRLIRVSVGKLPLLSGLPVVKELPQPWSKLQYMYISSALTRTDVALLNEKLEIESSENKLFFKPATRDAVDKDAATDPDVLVGGHHFVVVVDNEAVLDHVFEPDANPPPSEESPEEPTEEPTEPPATNPQEKPPTKGAMSKQLGILDVSGLSLQYKKNHLYVSIDATLKLGPLTFSLIGFGVGLNISKLKLNDLSDLGNQSFGDLIDFQLHGMEVVFDNPPILIAGCFYHDIFQRGDQTIDAYRGGIAVTVPPYTFVAVGEYAQVKERGVEFKSVFVFAKLDGPIIDFQFAILRGLRIGFGYNSIVRSPAVEELFEFPLIDNGASGGAGNHPMAILEKMSGGENPWIQLKNDEFWLAFGFTISSFNLVTATAVALVQFGGAGPIFRIFGDLNISYPPNDVSATAKIFNIEVVMMAELNFAEDCFKIEAALAPTSFVFVPYCRLKGGLALYTFFGNSPHAGDWVFTVGGYHRAFQVPAHYPKAARLGLDFNINIISIRGECYFAITPKAIMTGALIRCELKIGPVFAWLDASFDAMVQFSPLHYWVSMGIEVGVECRVPVLFCTIKIRICIGAKLEIEGPDFGGTAYVDFWFFSFSVDFGKRFDKPPPINLLEFYELCEKSGPPDTSQNASPAEDLVVQLKFSLEEGAFSMPSQDKEGTNNPDDTGPGTVWHVKGKFTFRISSVFALTESFLETEESAQRRQSDGKTLLLGQQNTTLMQEIQPGTSKLSSLPMELSAVASPGGGGITSKLCIAIQDVDRKGETVEGFKPSLILKEMPLTLWADKEPDRLSQEKGTVQLVMGVSLSSPDPILAISKIPEFNATDMAKLCAGSNKVPGLPAIAQVEFVPEFIPAPTSTPVQKWADMQQTWTNASTQNLDLANSLTELCMSTLGWDKPRPDIALKAEMTSTEPWKVPVAFPSRLVTGTGRESQGIEDGLDSFYLELPLTTTSIVH